MDRGKPISERAGIDYEIDPETGCWNWIKGKTERGYPNGYAHRRYFKIANGPDSIPKGWHIHHECRNAGCVNPAHLRAISDREHFLEHLQERTGLTLEQLIEIRELAQQPGVTMVEIAERYGKSYNNVWYLLSGRTWKELGGYVRPTPNCRNCGVQITTGNRHKVYCSPKCRSLYNAKKPEQRARISSYQRERRRAQRAQSAARL